MTMQVECVVCGQGRYQFKRSGLVIRRLDWNGEKVFHLAQYSALSATYAVESALEELVSAGFTNLGHREVGVIQP